MTEEQFERRLSAVNEPLDPDPRFATDLLADLSDRLGLKPSGTRTDSRTEDLDGRRARRGTRPWRLLLAAALLVTAAAGGALMAGSLVRRDDLLTGITATPSPSPLPDPTSAASPFGVPEASPVATASLRPVPGARNGLIAYSVADSVADSNGNVASEVHLIEPDGSNDRVIGGSCPTFSADGRVLARWAKPQWVGHGPLTLSSPEGKHPSTFTGIGWNQSPGVLLSPDLTQLAWQRDLGAQNNNNEFWVSPVSGGPGWRLVPGTFASDLMFWNLLRWSPDGRFIVLDGHPLTNEGELLNRPYAPSALYLVDAAGGEPRVLTSRRSGIGLDAAAWSPDGRRLAYSGISDTALLHPSSTPLASSAEGSDAPPSNFVATDLFVLDVDSGVERNVTQSPGSEFSPHWSPDGRRLAYIQAAGTVAVLDTDTWQPVGLADTTINGGFTWSPDGSRILAFSAVSKDLGENPDGSTKTDTTTTLRTIPLDDGTPWSITFPGNIGCSPSWQALADDQPASPGPTFTTPSRQRP